MARRIIPSGLIIVVVPAGKQPDQIFRRQALEPLSQFQSVGPVVGFGMALPLGPHRFTTRPSSCVILHFRRLPAIDGCPCVRPETSVGAR